MTIRNVDIDLEFMPIMNHIPVPSNQLHADAAQNDDHTIDYWRPIWLKNQAENHKLFGPFKYKNIGRLAGIMDCKPCIIAGSGPSLKQNAELLKNRPRGIGLVSCLHNFHFFEDRDIPVDYYVTLDSGSITIKEISEGGQNSEDWYAERSKDKTLLAYIASDPKLVRFWKGELFWYNCPVPDKEVKEAFEAVERFDQFVTNGGNVLGACLYIAKACFGANPIAYVGADFAFGYNAKFHSWDSQYDVNLGQIIKTPDIFGIPVKTWPSYHGFKKWHESITMRCPGDYYNCTEGGTFGAYPEGLLKTLNQKPLALWLEGYRLHEVMKYQWAHPENADENCGVEGVPDQPKILF